jgi:CPA2 family monovalent cation:H+ antiporter-2
VTAFDQFLRDLAVVLVTAGVVAVVFFRLRWPLVAGYLLAGVLVGPHLPPRLVSDESSIRLLSELGVILLMFSLGLDFRIRHLVRAASTAGVTSAVEVGLMLALGYAAGQILGWTPLASLFTGATVAISSTMIVSRAFREPGITGSLKETVVGTLVFEDLAAMLLIALLTSLAAGQQVTGATVGYLLARLGAVLALFLIVGMLIIPRAVRFVASLRHQETLVVTAVGVCFGLAWIAHLAGFSVALGAFLAGMLAAESGLAGELEDRMQPLRDMFAAIFFVAVGMELDPAAIGGAWVVVVGFIVLVVAGKFLGVCVGAFIAGRGTKEAVQAGLSLAQIGEFSFIISGIGVQAGVVPPLLGTVAVAVSMATAFLSSSLILRSARIAAWIDRRLPHRVQAVASLYGAWLESLRAVPPERAPWRKIRQAVWWLLLDASAIASLVGLGALTRDRLSAFAAAVGIPPATTSWLVTALVAALVAPFLFGIVRVSQLLGQHLAALAVPEPPPGKVDNGRAPRRTLAVALQIGIVLVVGGPLVVVTQPFMPGLAGLALLAAVLTVLGVAFWRSANDLLGHLRAGAELVVATLAKQSRADQMHFEVVRRMLPGLGDFEPVRVAVGSECAGQTLGVVNLRGRTGATVVALLRGDERVVFPEAGARLSGGDLVALTGSHDAIRSAAEILTNTKPG